jgi:hypothetical protein
MYLGWYDPDKKKKSSTKLKEAVARYQEKYGKTPAVVLLNAADAQDYPGVEVRVVGHVAPTPSLWAKTSHSKHRRWRRSATL